MNEPGTIVLLAQVSRAVPPLHSNVSRRGRCVFIHRKTTSVSEVHRESFALVNVPLLGIIIVTKIYLSRAGGRPGKGNG